MQPTQESKSTPTAAMRAAASPAVRPFLDSLPLPNGPLSLVGCNLGTAMALPIACSGKFNLAFSQPNSIDSISARLDHNFGDRNRVFLRYSLSDTPSNGLEGEHRRRKGSITRRMCALGRRGLHRTSRHLFSMISALIIAMTVRAT